VKLTTSLLLLAAGLVLMCLGVQRLFFLGLALVVLSGLFSLRPKTRVSRLSRTLSWVARLGAIALLLWLSSSGREPLSWAGACAGIFAVGMTELGYWRATRRTAESA
jgi:hypothetical protein